MARSPGFTRPSSPSEPENPELDWNLKISSFMYCERFHILETQNVLIALRDAQIAP